MKTTIEAQQTAFFTQNGFIEFEIPHEELLAPLHRAAPIGRDLWRKEPLLQQFLIRKLGPIALVLTGKKQLRLACDQWIAASDLPKKAAPLKELLSIQGVALAVALAEHPHIPVRRSPLGILPVPSNANHLFFFRPDLILDWPHVSNDLYFATYAFPSSVYIHNPKDPFTSALKAFGYQFGDVLKNEFHPLITH